MNTVLWDREKDAPVKNCDGTELDISDDMVYVKELVCQRCDPEVSGGCPSCITIRTAHVIGGSSPYYWKDTVYFKEIDKGNIRYKIILAISKNNGLTIEELHEKIGNNISIGDIRYYTMLLELDKVILRALDYRGNYDLYLLNPASEKIFLFKED